MNRTQQKVKSAGIISVFIASPSDVEEERKIVRRVCENLNKDPLVKEKRIRLEPVGWEDVVPSAGRPQDTINLLQKDCDIFICILHKKIRNPHREFRVRYRRRISKCL